MAVTIQRAVQKAVASRLRARLSDVTVFDHWPDPERQLPAKAISVLLAGPRADTTLDIYQIGSENIHDELPGRLVAATPTDLATAIVALNEFKANWNAHAASTASHLLADTTNVIASDAATDLDTAIDLANEARTVFAPHVASTSYHEAADTLSILTAPVATDEPTLVTLTAQLQVQTNKHYAARVYIWRVRACEQPMQLDVWTTYDAVREDVVARLDTELNVDATAALVEGPDPVRNGLLVDLADGWTGTIADVLFDAPDLDDSEDSKGVAEYRATYRGTAFFNLCVRAQSARLARVAVRQTMTPPGGPESPDLSVTVTATTETYG